MAENPLERFERLIAVLESAEGLAELDDAVRAILPYIVSGSSYLERGASKALKKAAEKHPDYDWTHARQVFIGQLGSLDTVVRWNVGEVLVASARTSDMDLAGIRRHMGELIDLFRQAACAGLVKFFEGEYSLLYIRIAKAMAESKKKMDAGADGEVLEGRIDPPKGKPGSADMFRTRTKSISRARS